MKSFVQVVAAPLCASFVLFSNLSLLLLKVQGISLEELGSRGKNPLHHDDRELVQFDEDEDEWEINQVFLASKMAYMVTKGERYLKSLPWSADSKTWNDVSDERFHKRVLARETDRACYIAHMNPFSETEPMNAFGFGPFGMDVDGLAKLTAAELIETEEWASGTDSSMTCTTRKMFTMLLPYDFADQLAQYVDGCVENNKRIIHTGHSYGGALATLAALEDEAIQPWLITFGAPPIFKAECSLIHPERNVRIVNTEVTDVYPTVDADQKEPLLTYDIISWNFMEVLAKAFLMGPPSEPPLRLIYAAAVNGSFPSMVTILQGAGVRPDQYPPFMPKHPSGGATLLAPFPFRSAPSLTFLNDTFAQNSSSMTGQLFWYESVLDPSPPNFNTHILYPVNTMRKYYSKIRELWLQKRLSLSNGFEHGTYCQDDLHCMDGTSCASPPGNITTMCLIDYSAESPQMCVDPAIDCALGEFCVDGLCSAGQEGDFCLGHFDCEIPICIKGRCSTGDKGQPCMDKYLDCLKPRVCNLRHFDFYRLCWNTDMGPVLEEEQCEEIDGYTYCSRTISLRPPGRCPTFGLC